MAALARTVPYRTRIGVAAQWASPVAVGLRNIALRLLPCAGSDAAVAAGQLRLAGFQAGIDWSLATPL